MRLKHRRNESNADWTPAPADILDGEVGINITRGLLYSKTTGGTVLRVGSNMVYKGLTPALPVNTTTINNSLPAGHPLLGVGDYAITSTGSVFVYDGVDWTLVNSSGTNWVTGHIETPSVKNYIIDPSAFSDYSIAQIRLKTEGGDCDVTLKIQGVALVDVTTINVTTTLQTIDIDPDETVAATESLVLEVVANNSAADLTFSILAGVA